MNTPIITPTRRAILGAAIALYDRAEAECERFDKEVEMPARKASTAAIAALPVELPPPHEQIATTFVNAFGDTVRLSTANIGTVAVARKLISDPAWSDMGDENWRQAHREIAAAVERRGAVIAKQAARRAALEKEARARFPIDRITARSNSLDDRRYRLGRAVITLPAENMTDLVAKLSFIDRTRQADEIDAQLFAAISADIRNLAGEG